METQGEPLTNLDSNDHWDQEERVLIISRTKRLIGSDLAVNDIWTEGQPWNFTVTSVCLYHKEKELTDKETLEIGNS